MYGLVQCLRDLISRPIMRGYGAEYRIYMRALSGLTTSTERPSRGLFSRSPYKNPKGAESAEHSNNTAYEVSVSVAGVLRPTGPWL